MTNAYKRPTRIVELPSGKKVEIVEYFSQSDIDTIKYAMIEGQKIKGSKILEMKNNSGENNEGEQLMQDMEFDLDIIEEANIKTRNRAIRGLIDIDGTKYDATPENIEEFIESGDAETLDKEINKSSKKKLTKEA
jgi:hypothetical protein